MVNSYVFNELEYRFDWNCRDSITIGPSPSFQNPQRTFDNDDGEVVHKKESDIPSKAVSMIIPSNQETFCNGAIRLYIFAIYNDRIFTVDNN